MQNMQGAKLCKLQNMQGAKLSKMLNFTRCIIMQSVKLYRVQNYAKYKIKQRTESGQKIIQFNIQFKIESKIFIQ